MDKDIIHLEGLLIPLMDAPNREHKRKMEKECKQIVDAIWEVEELFYVVLFSKVNYAYNDIYINYLNLFLSKIKDIKPKYWHLNEHYFEKFKPIEII